MHSKKESISVNYADTKEINDQHCRQQSDKEGKEGQNRL